MTIGTYEPNGDSRAERWSKSGAIVLLARVGMAVVGLVSPLLIAVGLWVGNVLWDLNTKVTALTEKVAPIAKLYSRDDAAADFRARDQKDQTQDMGIARNYQDMQENRGRIRSLESWRSRANNGG